MRKIINLLSLGQKEKKNKLYLQVCRKKKFYLEHDYLITSKGMTRNNGNLKHLKIIYLVNMSKLRQQ